MQTHFCKESPCPVQDAECATILQNGFKRTYTLTPLEQFNEEVMSEIPALYIPEEYRSEIQSFIIQKLAAHKELILKMVREKAKIRIKEELNKYIGHLSHEEISKIISAKL